MTDMENYILKGKGMRELYEVVSRYPDGVKVSEIKQLFPEISVPRLSSMLVRMYDAGIVTRTRPKERRGCIWKVL